MHNHFVHRSFSLTDFVADAQEMINPVLVAYSKVIFVLVGTRKHKSLFTHLVLTYITSMFC